MSQPILSILPNPRRPIAFVKPDTTALTCAKKMRDEDIGALVVHDIDTLIGIVSERDLVRACLSKSLDPTLMTAFDLAYKHVQILDAKDSIEKAMEVITHTKRRHVLISEEGQLTAVLSIGDLLFYLLDHKSRVIDHLEQYINT